MRTDRPPTSLLLREQRHFLGDCAFQIVPEIFSHPRKKIRFAPGKKRKAALSEIDVKEDYRWSISADQRFREARRVPVLIVPPGLIGPSDHPECESDLLSLHSIAMRLRLRATALRRQKNESGDSAAKSRICLADARILCYNLRVRNGSPNADSCERARISRGLRSRLQWRIRVPNQFRTGGSRGGEA